MPIDYSRYPANWHTEIRPAILKRARQRCESCGVPNNKVVYWEKSDKYVIVDELIALWCKANKIKPYKIALAVAHLNHDITDNRPENLRALCQRCHNKHDRHYRAENRMLRYRGVVPGAIPSPNLRTMVNRAKELRMLHAATLNHLEQAKVIMERNWVRMAEYSTQVKCMKVCSKFRARLAVIEYRLKSIHHG